MKPRFSNKRIISIIVSIVIVLISSFVFAIDFLDTEISEEVKRLKSTLENNSFFVVNYVGLSEHSIHMEGATIDWFEGEQAHQRFLTYDINEVSDEYLFYYTLYMWMSGHVEQVHDICSYVESRGLSKPWNDHFKFFMGAVSYVEQDYEMAYAYLNSVESYKLYGEEFNQLSHLISNAMNDENSNFKTSDETPSEEYEAISKFYSNLDKYNYKINDKKESGRYDLTFELLGKPFEGVLVVSSTGKAVYTDYLGLARLDSEASIFYIPWQKIHNTSLDMRNWKTQYKFQFKEGIDLLVELSDNDKLAYSLSARHHMLIKNEKVSLHVQNGSSESEILLNHESGSFRLSEMEYSSPFENPSDGINQKLRFNVEVDGFQNGFFSTALSQNLILLKGE